MIRFTLADIDRCPHGRHRGDDCAGWRGPGEFDGGCEGGVSLGNPWWAQRGTHAGTTLNGETVLVADIPPMTLPGHCEWAPLDHWAPGIHVVTFARPCRCTTEQTRTCRGHLLWLRATPEAKRATPCPHCGVMAPLNMIAEERWQPAEVTA